MSRLLDRLKNAERTRRDLRARRSETADAVAGAAEKAKLEQPGAAIGERTDRAKSGAAQDETFWAEVRKRLTEEGQQRRVRDTFSPDEVRALARAAGVKALLAQIEGEMRAEAEARKRAALERDAAEAADRKAQLEGEARDRARLREEAERKLRDAAEQHARSEARALGMAQQRTQAEAEAAAQAKARIRAEQAALAQEQQRQEAELQAEAQARQRIALEQAALEETARRREETARADEATAKRMATEQERRAATKAKLAAERELAAAQARAALATRAARRAKASGERTRITSAQIGAGLRRFSRPLAVVAVAFALGFGASALWLMQNTQDGLESSRAQASVQAEAPAGQPSAQATPVLRLDLDHAGFAARAASAGRKSR